MIGLVATVLLQIPFFKHMFAWMGCHPAGESCKLLSHANKICLCINMMDLGVIVAQSGH